MLTGTSEVGILTNIKALLESEIPSNFDLHVFENELRDCCEAVQKKNENNYRNALRNIKSLLSEGENTGSLRGIPGEKKAVLPKLEIIEIFNEMITELKLKKLEIDRRHPGNPQSDKNAERNKNN